MPDFPVRDTGLCQQRYPTFPSATFDRKTPVSGLKPSGSISKPISVPKKVVSSPSMVTNLQKTRQFRPKRNRPKKRFSDFDTPSKRVSPNIIRGFVKSAAQKTGKVQLYPNGLF